MSPEDLTGCAVDHRTNLWVLVQLSEELLRRLIVTNLGELKGNTATVTIADVNQSNGVIHVIDTVLIP